MFGFLSEKSKRFLCFLVPLVLFGLGCIVLYRFNKFNLLPDSISYISIAQRYLRGDYANAINGYWSPLNIWLTAICVKLMNMPATTAFYVLHCMSFAGFIILSVKLFARFLKKRSTLLLSGITIAFFALLNIPSCTVADSLNAFLVLAAIDIMSRDDFLQKWYKWVAWSIVAVLAAYSKAYSLYILPLILLCFLLYQYFLNRDKSTKRQVVKIIGIITVLITILISPWMYLLQQKYGVWLFSTSGKLNSSWSVVGHLTFNNDTKCLLPPALKDGLSYWEDPWQRHGDFVSPFHSGSYFIRQLYRIYINLMNWIQCVNGFSPFYITVWLAGVILLLKSKIKDRSFGGIVIAYILFPLGYWIVAVHPRYIFVTMPLVMLTGLYVTEQYIAPKVSRLTCNILLAAYFISWIPGSVVDAKDALGVGRKDWATAQTLTGLSIKGSFITNLPDHDPAVYKLSFYTGNPVYFNMDNNCSRAIMIQEAASKGVRYYFYYYNSAEDSRLSDAANLERFPELTSGRIPGLKVFDISRAH